MFWDFLEKATKDSSSHSLYLKKSSKDFSGVMCTPDYLSRCFVKSGVTISCSADPVGNACFTLLFQLKQVNWGFIFAVPCGNLISLLYLVQSSVFASSNFFGGFQLCCASQSSCWWPVRLYLLLLKDTPRCCPSSGRVTAFQELVTALTWVFIWYERAVWFLGSKGMGKLWLLGVLPSAFQLRNSIDSQCLAYKIQHSGVVQWGFSAPEFCNCSSSTQTE